MSKAVAQSCSATVCAGWGSAGSVCKSSEATQKGVGRPALVPYLERRVLLIPPCGCRNTHLLNTTMTRLGREGFPLSFYAMC